MKKEEIRNFVSYISVVNKQVKCPSCKHWLAADYHTQDDKRFYSEDHYCNHCRVFFSAKPVD